MGSKGTEMPPGFEQPEMVTDLPRVLSAFAEVAVLLASLVAIVWGVIECFFGYRIIKMVLAFYGFMLGLIAGVVYSVFVMAAPTGMALVITIACGVIGAVIMVLLLFVGVFLIGAGQGALLVLLVLVASGASRGRQFAIGPDMFREHMVAFIAAGVVGGVIALIFRRFVIIVYTAFQGAGIVVLGALAATEDPVIRALSEGRLTDARQLTGMLGRRHSIALLCWLGLAILGVVVQYSSARTRSVRGERDKNLSQLLERAKSDAGEGGKGKSS